MIIEEGATLTHTGVKRRSGRYPWGSGEDPHQHSTSFLSQVSELRGRGMSNAAISKALGFSSTTDFRAEIAIHENAARAELQSTARRLRDKGMSPTEIGRQMGKNESTIRSLLDPSRQAKNEVLDNTANLLRDRVNTGKMIQIGLGTEASLGISKEKLAVAVAMLKKEGYTVHNVQVEQIGRPGQFSDTKVLAPPGTTLGQAFKNRHDIELIQGYSDDNGHTITKIQPPKSVSLNTVEVRYGPDGGSKMDGVIELRRGVPELSLEGKRYAQVRIAVDDTHYMKGMAIYADDLPPGKNIRYNSNKDRTGDPYHAFKPIKDDPDTPFGSIVRQRYYTDSKGVKQLSPINVVGSKPGSYEEGGWADWSKRISSQMLSKQSPQLAKQQLDLTYRSMKADLDSINKLTNPAVKRKLLLSFADDCDSSANKMPAAAFPRQTSRVILPLASMKPTEVYAPGYKHGERVVLIRHPHGGTFEIPELTVNNTNRQAKKLFGDIQDAVVINHKVAERLSGADFDGDSVLVIPNNQGKIKTSRPLKELEGFDTKRAYPYYEGMKIMGAVHQQKEMGIVSNLITDMTIKGANPSEIAKAVKHSMVVIDANKHKLNYQQSYRDNEIAALKLKYQPKPNGKGGGAATLLSRSNSEARAADRTPRRYKEGGPIDPVTGEKVYTPTGKTTRKVLRDKEGNILRGADGKAILSDPILKTVKSTAMAETKDAFSLVSGYDMEMVYATHANRLKALANEARLSSLKTPPAKYSPSAKKAYANEVASLSAKLNVADKNRPLERQAQIVAGLEVRAKRLDNPTMDKKTLSKTESIALTKARSRVGAENSRISITPKEWEAIQAGAISDHKLNSILLRTDNKVIAEYATPRTKRGMPASKLTMAKTMQARGYLSNEIASQLGVSEATLKQALAT